MKPKSTIRHTFFILFFFVITLTGGHVFAAPARVAVLPFDVNAEKDLTFLSEGILDMLSSRLAWQGKVDVINEKETKAALASTKGFEGESRALLVGGKLKANYVLFGSLTVFGESVSIDAKMVDVSGQQPPVPFFAQTQGMGGVIPQINLFASNINAQVFGRGTVRQPTVAQTPAVAPRQPAQQQQAQQPYNPRMHPEKLLQGGIQPQQTPVAGQPTQTLNPAFVGTGALAANNANTFWKSRRFKSLITGIDIGDVDNDGQIETVILNANSVMIYRNQKGQFSRLTEVEKINRNQYLGVDVADINGNGTPEIFISAVGARKESFASFVLEYDGTTYKKLFSGLPWHYRVIKTVAGEPFLVGQKQPPKNGTLQERPIFRMHWDGSGYKPVEPFLPGGKANILGVTAGNIINDNLINIIGYSNSDRVQVFKAGGAVEWRSDDAHGGNLSFYRKGDSELGTGVKDSLFFPMRIRTADLDGNGTSEVIVASNNELTDRLMQNQRSYNNSKFISFAWQGLGLVPAWKTNKMRGRITDYVIGDFDNDGVDELVGSVARKEGRVTLTDSESVVIAYELSAAQ